MKGRVALLTFAAIAFLLIPVMISIGVPIGRSGFQSAGATGLPPPVTGDKPKAVPEVGTVDSIINFLMGSLIAMIVIPIILILIIIAVISSFAN